MTEDGKIRIYGFSATPTEPLTPVSDAGDDSLTLKLKPGRYSWCTCGYSQNQPFCDNAHREAPTNRKSYKFEVLAETIVEFCLCRRTGTPPFCDGVNCGEPPADNSGRDDE